MNAIKQIISDPTLSEPTLLPRQGPQTALAVHAAMPMINLIEAQVMSQAVMIGNYEVLDGVQMDDRPVLLGIRPDAVHLSPDAHGPVSLDYVARLGVGRLFHGVLEGEAIVAQLPAHAKIAPRMALLINPADVMIFDAYTGQRLIALRVPVARPDYVF
ncbi:hypothetical protein BFP70_12535 [Thioclava sp. SK-1]|uniref:hypothetical protein n=1 Tax=Thioclava sp. SK-1 TaxID=1889770 RepID=UPI0008251DD6|nr:hypothetical protein [Thioclava sp. SK-1]OCX63044.1 hypothetical protein BFP70_12535 [Thioclava sp. SK-1]